MSDITELLKAIDKLWKAHEVSVVNGGGAWKRHVEPAIYNLRSVSQRFKGSMSEYLENEDKPEGHKKPVTYAAGFFNKLGEEIGMFAGPELEVQALLDQVPPFDQERRSAYIIRFDSDDSWFATHKWNPQKNNWVELPPEEDDASN